MSYIKWEKVASVHDWKEDLGWHMIVETGICLVFIQLYKIPIQSLQKEQHFQRTRQTPAWTINPCRRLMPGWAPPS